MVDGTDYFVHSLNVALPGVQLRVEEEHPLDDLPVSLATFVQRRVVPAVQTFVTTDFIT